ncbi:hypothetical protein [Rhodoferax sp. UBA5149]|uniref:hypothetical protein n=1 Tax=Rhodoferax sp. UBA5149 TaxID=1947379 RepID=UPI0025F8650B|nr:hypothetical protein [Rhodoferax sp. UBA5149]
MNFLRCVLLICAAGVACASSAGVDSVVTLRAKYASLDEALRQNQFKRPLVLDSVETPNRLQGDIYAVIEHPFGVVSAGLDHPDHWCDVMILHVNTKYCHATVGPSGTVLKVYVGKKTPEELTFVPHIEFIYSVAAATPNYLEILLQAQDGPMGTSDYRIQLQAVALANDKSFLHLTYSYATNFAGQLAMQTYLATLGRGKVGFTVTGKGANGEPAYIGGVRGVVERNTMRYYLAIDSFLQFTNAAPTAQLEKRLQAWFTAIERYPRQLHDLDQGAYLEMKRAEYLRQQTVQ